MAKRVFGKLAVYTLADESVLESQLPHKTVNLIF